MDLVRVIHKLHEERAKLDGIIASLEQLQKSVTATVGHGGFEGQLENR